MAEINDFPSGTSSRPSHTPDPAAALRNVFGEEPPPPEYVFGEEPPPPPPLISVSDVGQCSWDNAVMPESQSSTAPRLNMEFSSEEEAYNFYNNYAEQLGFKVRKGKVQRPSNRKVPHTSDGKAPINKRTFLCSKEGERSQKESEKTRKYRRKETRTGCQAEIRIELKNGKWVIYKCSLGHNHELERPGQGHESDNYYPDNSQVTVTESPVDRARVVDTEAGTPEDRSPEEVRVSNLPDKNVAKLPPDDVQRLLNRFSHLQAEDPSFFYAIQVNSENQMTSFFWRDGRSRIDYAYFADMLVLDTCRYRMDNNVICAPFFGVNHHKDPVLFGCAFLLEETEESFRWLFRTFLEAMGYSQPKTLFTALSEDIARAAEKEFPETKHCIVWNFIIVELDVKMETYYNGGNRFEFLFDNWGIVRNFFLRECHEKILTTDSDGGYRFEFEERWNHFMEECELREDPWLAFAYKSWEKWSPLLGEVLAFAADIELLTDIDEYFDIFPEWKKTTLSVIFEEYLKATEKFRSVELLEDFKSNRVPYKERIGMDKHAVDVYTRNVYEEFKWQFKNIMSLAMEEVSPGPTCVFKLKDIANGSEEEVSFDCSSSTVSCSCKKFERKGILCSHSLKVLNVKNIFRIPEQYVLKRWTRSAKQGVEVKGNSAGDNMDEKSRRLHSRNLMYKALNVITKSVATEETREIVERHLDLALQQTENSLQRRHWYGNSRDDEDNDEDNDEICCGERHCPFGKRKKIGSASSSDKEVHGS